MLFSLHSNCVRCCEKYTVQSVVEVAYCLYIQPYYLEAYENIQEPFASVGPVRMVESTE